MSDRDDDGHNSPEGKGLSEEGQRRKSALAQLTVDGGSDESGPPKPFDMKKTIEKEKKAEDFEDFMQKLRTKVDNKGPLVKFIFSSKIIPKIESSFTGLKLNYHVASINQKSNSASLVLCYLAR